MADEKKLPRAEKVKRASSAQRSDAGTPDPVKVKPEKEEGSTPDPSSKKKGAAK